MLAYNDSMVFVECTCVLDRAMELTDFESGDAIEDYCVEL